MSLIGRAITPQANAAQEIMHLLTREDGGKEVVILGADLGEDAPQGALEQLDKEEFCAGQRLADRLWLPVFVELDVKQVVAQMRFLQGGRVALEVLVQQAHRTVVHVTGALGIEAQCEQLRVLRHRQVRMPVIDRISGLSAAPCAARSLNMALWWNDFGLVHRPVVSYPLAMQSLLASRRPGVSQTTTPRSGLFNTALEPTAAPLLRSTFAVVRTRRALHRPRWRLWLSFLSLGNVACYENVEYRKKYEE